SRRQRDDDPGVGTQGAGRQRAVGEEGRQRSGWRLRRIRVARKGHCRGSAESGESAVTRSRRQFTKAFAMGTMGLAAASVADVADLADVVGLASPTLHAQKRARRLKVGHTGITWGFKPTDAEGAIKDVASLGYHGYESFGGVLEYWEQQGGFDAKLKAVNLPLQSAYSPINLTDPTKRKDEIAKLVRWGQLIKKCGGKVAVIGPNNVKRPAFDFAAEKATIVASLNEMCKALDGIGIVGALHQHTGTCVETRDETYAVMEA